MAYLKHLVSLAVALLCSSSLASITKRAEAAYTDPIPTATLVFPASASDSPKEPPELSKFEQIHANSYFYIDPSCTSGTSIVDHKHYKN